MHLSVRKDFICAFANTLIKGTEWEQYYPDGVNDFWYVRFMSNNTDKITTAFANTMDLDREKWTTSENLKRYYDNIEKTLLDLGFIVPNPSYDPSVPLDYSNLHKAISQQYTWIESKKCRVMSFDETHCTLNSSRESGRTPQDRVVVAVPSEGERMDSTVVTNKSSVDFTMVGGSAVSGQGIFFSFFSELSVLFFFSILHIL